jgi:O-antigen/teichoic acid export membrane protein
LQLRVRHIVRNVMFNWFGTIANMAVGFFLAPFILHRLGDVAYGVWALAVSVVGYLGLLDLGMQSSVLRFVSKGHTKGNHQDASDVISAALWVRLQLSVLALLLSAALSAAFPFLFKIPAAIASDARIAILLIGLTTAITLSVGVVAGVLSALNRYDLQNYLGLTQTAIRVIGVVTVLRTGHGIVAIAVCELVATIVGQILLAWIARRLYPELKIRLAKPKRETLRQIWVYSSYAFLTTIAVQLVYQADNLVVGAFISAAAVTYYAIANNLCRFANQIISSIGGTFVPAASTYEAAGDTAGLLALYRNGTRTTIMVSLPILVTLAIRGRTFVSLWMGPQYGHSSGILLFILCSSLFFAFANRTASSIAFGVEKHKTAALWAVGEGIANLALSITLVHWYGIYGVALGTTIPSLVVHLFFWPRYVSKLVGLSSFDVVWKVWGPMILAGVPFAVASYAVNALLPTPSLAIFFLQVFAVLPVFLITVALIFRHYVRQSVMPRVRSLLFSRAQ